MIVFPDSTSPKLPEMINSGAVGVMLTDTLYCIVARVDNQAAVERLFSITNRSSELPPIVLISDVSQLYDPLPAGIDPTVGDLWPGPNSVVVAAPSAPEWLRRGSAGVAYRIPSDSRLLRILAETGPLLAPSANPDGKEPAKSIGEAEGYFGEAVDFYVDGSIAFDRSQSSMFSLTSTGDIEQIR